MRTCVLFAIVALAGPAWAEVPFNLSAQGVLRDGAGVPISDARTMTFRIYDVADVVWEETIVDVPVASGVFAVYLGNVVAIDPAIFQASIELYLGVTVEGDSAELPRQRLVTVPYAFEAQDAAGLGGLPSTSWQRRFSGACSTGFVTDIAADGTAVCAPELGDITEIVAGSGLTGSATAGIAALAVAFAGTGAAATAARSDHDHAGVYLPLGATLSCSPGQVVQSINPATGSVTCAADADAGGDITAVNPGTGINGGGTSGAVTIAVDTSAIQARVGGTCAPGTSIASISATGTVTCESDDVGPTYTAGNGLTLAGSQLEISTAGCAENEVLVHHASTTPSWSCEQIGGATVADGSLTKDDILDEPGLTGSLTLGSGTLSAVPWYMNTVDFIVPAGGYVMLTIQATFNNPVGSTTQYLNMELEIEGSAWKTWRWDPGDADGAMDQTQSFTVAGFFSNPGEPVRIYLKGTTSSGTVTFTEAYITAVYIPSGLGG